MLTGSITLEDIHIAFLVNYDDNTVTFTVTDMFNGIHERRTVDQASFFCALAIAVHNDGMPDYKRDYPAAERVMALGKIRWIP